MPTDNPTKLSSLFKIFTRPKMKPRMLATFFVFMSYAIFFSYLRPFLETVTNVHGNMLLKKQHQNKLLFRSMEIKAINKTVQSRNRYSGIEQSIPSLGMYFIFLFISAVSFPQSAMDLSRGISVLPNFVNSYSTFNGGLLV